VCTYDDRLVAVEQRMVTLTYDLAATRSDFLSHFVGLDRSIATLNKTVANQEKEIGDIHHNMTILLGVVGSQGQDIKAIKEDLHVVKGDVNVMKGDMDVMKGDLSAVKENMVTKEDLGAVKENMVALETRMEARMTAMETRVETRMTAMETRMLDGFEHILAVIDSRLPPAA